MGWKDVAKVISPGYAIAGELDKKRGGVNIQEDANVSRARQRLMDFADTGKWGDFKVGEGYEGDLGAYDMTGMERRGEGALSRFMDSGGVPDVFGHGTQAISDVLQGDRFDPYSEKGEFQPFMEALRRELGEASTGFKRSAAFGGNLFSGATAKGLADIQSKGHNVAASKMAEEYNRFQDRRMQAIPMALQAGQMGQQMQALPIQMAYAYGGLPRTLEDQKAKDTYGEWMRSRGEYGMQMGAAQSVLGGPQHSSINIPGQNMWQGLLEKGTEAAIRGFMASKGGG